MNLKFWLTLLLVIVAMVFVPIVPNVTPIECHDADTSCDEDNGYISIYQKFFK